MKTKKISIINRRLLRAWNNYKRIVAAVTCKNEATNQSDIAYWREALFNSFITYLLPVCLIALIPGIIIAIKDGYTYIAIFDFVAAIGITLGTFNCNFSLNFRKMLVMVLLYGLSIVLLIGLGLFGPGLIYLFALSIFITLIFPRRYAYWSVAFNLLICLCCGLIIEFKLISSPLLRIYNFGAWMAISSNLIFLSWVSVLLISKTINSLERIIVKDRHLTDKFRIETANGILRNQELRESEGYYKKLFLQGPSPMWILDSRNLQFLQVNESAIQEYGYTSEEFLAMTIMDIKLPKDQKYLDEDLHNSISSQTPLSILTHHRRKNKEQFPVEVKFTGIVFKGKAASLVIARDISEQVDHINAIEFQNAQLMEIAYIQSHHVRAPLARIMGLVNMMATCGESEKPELLAYLDKSAKELDAIVRKTVDTTQRLKAIRTTG